MTPRRLLLLALTALLATGGAFWLSSQRHLERAVRSGDPLLPALRGAVNDVTEIRIGRGDGSRVTLQRGADGWTVLERRFTADVGKVRKLLLDLGALEIVEEKTHDPARYAVLGVEDVVAAAATGTRVDVQRSNGSVVGVIVGKGSGARESYVRRAGAKPSFLARPQLSVDASPAAWLDKTLVDLDPARIRFVAIESAGKPVRRFEGATLTAALAGALDELKLDDLRARLLEAGSRAPAVRARYVTWEGLTIAVDGREEGNRRWIALSPSADPADAKPRPAAARSPAAAGSPAASPDSKLEPKLELDLLKRRFDGREFEIPAYRFATLFDTAPAGP